MESNPALSTVDKVLEVADRFFEIADLLHRRLTVGLDGIQSTQHSTDLYSLLVDEYGLRARAAILRNDAKAHTVSNTSVWQDHLLSVLCHAGVTISRINSLEQLRSVIAGVSTLCVSISPGKGAVVDFLLTQLEKDLDMLNK